MFYRTPEETKVVNGTIIVISSSEDSSPENGTKAVGSNTQSTSGDSPFASPSLFSSFNSSIESQRKECVAVNDLSPLQFDESFPGSLSCLKNSFTNLKYVHSTPNNKVFNGHLSGFGETINLSSCCENHNYSSRSRFSCANQHNLIMHRKTCSVLLEQLPINGSLVNKKSSNDSLPCSGSLSSLSSSTAKDRNCVNGEDNARRHQRASCPSSISCQHDSSKHGSGQASILIKECTVSLEKLRLTPLLSKSRKRRNNASALSQSDESGAALTPVKSFHLPASVLSFKVKYI